MQGLIYLKAVWIFKTRYYKPEQSIVETVLNTIRKLAYKLELALRKT